MGRDQRIQYKDAFYHVYNRGVEKRDIFMDSHDYEKFIKLLHRGWQKYAYVCYVYCLMPNHYHLFLKTPNGNIAKIMQWLNARYAQYFNGRWSRVGTLFQGRFRSEIVDKDSYSLELSRYIHLNPVRARLVTNPDHWRWSSWRAYVDQREKIEFLNTDWILKQFANNRDRYQQFVLGGMNGSDTCQSQG